LIQIVQGYAYQNYFIHLHFINFVKEP